MRPVAKRLIFRPAAAAIPVVFALNELDLIGAFLSNNGFVRHVRLQTMRSRFFASQPSAIETPNGFGRSRQVLTLALGFAQALCFFLAINFGVMPI